MAENVNDFTLVESFLNDNLTINFIRYQWIDYSGILRVRVLTVSHCRRLAMKSSPLAMSPVAMTSSTFNEFMPDLIPTGVDYIHPDFTSLRPCLYAPGHASVMCFVSEGIGNVGFNRCPRTILSAACNAGKELGVKVGFEVEFICLNTDGAPLEDCIAGWSSMGALRNRCLPILEEIVQILELSGIEVYQFHSEGTTAMFEISTGPLPPIQAVDAWVYTRETVKTLFAKHSIIATLHPSPTPQHYGIGAHIHLSISASGEICDTFLGGIISRLSALCAFSLPLEESYKRVNDFESEAGAYVAWGTENRDVPIRKIGTGHWEIRCCDGSANMYLVLAAIISSGVEGARVGEELVWGDCQGNPSSADPHWRRLLGIQEALPKDLRESLKALRDFDWSNMGLDQAVTTYAKIKEQELISLQSLSEDERRALMIRQF